MLWFLLIIGAFWFANGQLDHNAVGEHHHHHHMAHLQNIDVKCAKSGMEVILEFDQPFNGVVFSKGYYSNPSCRYVAANSGKNSYVFRVPMADCGTTPTTGGRVGFENTLVFQNEAIIQEIWDTARKISCDWQQKMQKQVVFRPFSVGMLDVMEVKFNADDVKCWMDIKVGEGPFGDPISSVVKIGDELSVVVYAKDDGGDFDILVKNCYAFGAENFDDPSTERVRLSDENGCPVKEKLMGYFYRTKKTKDTGADMIAFARLNAFRFPDSMEVFLSCDIELCKGGCEQTCRDPGYPTNLVEEFELFPDPVTTPAPKDEPSTPFICTPGSYDPRCPQPTTPPFRCTPGSLDPRCPQPTTTPFRCTPGSLDPRCPQPTTTPFRCTPGSLDPRCPQTTTTPFRCTPGSKDPRCPQPTTTPFRCTPGSKDPRCPQPTTTPFRCTPGSKDPRCPQPTTTPFRCTPGSKDPRCPQPTTTPFRCTPGSKDPRCPQPTTTPFRCTPGSKDPRCPQPTTTPFRCTPGSKDPRCPQPTTTPFRCTPGSKDPRCPQPTTTPFRCTPGSKDPRCPQPTTTPFRCTPGSKDPRCPQPTTPTTQKPCSSFSNDPQCNAPSDDNTQKVCPPGTIGPDCKPPTTTTQRPTTVKPADPPAPTRKPEGWEGESPKYHAFHAWQYQKAPRRRNRIGSSVNAARKKRELKAPKISIRLTSGMLVAPSLGHQYS